MAERGLDEMDRRAAVEGVAGVGVAHPVRGNLLLEAGLFSGCVDDAADLGDVQRSSALAARKYGIGFPGISFDGLEQLPDRGLQQNRPGFAAFAENRDLAAFLALPDIAPFQTADLADAEGGDVTTRGKPRRDSSGVMGRRWPHLECAHLPDRRDPSGVTEGFYHGLVG